MSQTTLAPAVPAIAGAARVPMTATLLEPVHHGAGTTGNIAKLRRQQIVLPDGRKAAVPYVSGNSLRHRLRDALAWNLVTVLDVPQGSLSKPIVDLLWSGGSISRTGSEVDLARARRVEQLLPFLALMGYATGADMVAGTLTVANLQVVCAENAFRLPPSLAGHPHAVLPAGSLQSEEFATRHDPLSGPIDRLVQDTEPPATSQMIYEMQVLEPGAVLFGSFGLGAGASPGHRAVLAAALDLAAPSDAHGRRVIHLGGKSAVGYGTALLDLDWNALCDLDQAAVWWRGHLLEHRTEILELLREVAA